jgi:hypothetical protein
MGKHLHIPEQNFHYILHLDIEGNDFLFIVTTLLLEIVGSLEHRDNDCFLVTTHEPSLIM